MATTRITTGETWCFYIPLAIARTTLHQSRHLYRRVLHGALVRLERSAAKVARCVLRGERSCEAPDLPGASKRALRHARWKSAQLGADRPESAPTLAVAWRHGERSPPAATYAATTTQVDNNGARGGSLPARGEYGTQTHRHPQCRCQRL